ncbi:ribonuclease HIII [Aciduricibacillus chroicocephali]|uniref:Ribonuclease HIII n=1 Tax=Aciduricibacillus chroicocephali TaxID=3054939 RepID=A0ABY9KS58_9BACI|nr:ribonuclease HIII [Bacillaceae bacterium 44XB]
MPQEVLTVPKTVIEKMKMHYAQYIEVSTPPGAVFRAKTSNAAITAYNSGKVLFQGKAPEAEARLWNAGATIGSKKKTPSKASAPATKQSHESIPEGFLVSSHIGSDEAGTGDYFGPITVACAFVPGDKIELLQSIGVQDSKNLTDATIRKLATDIVKLDIPYALLVLHNEKYNRLQRKGWSQGKMKAMLHHHAIEKLLSKIDGIPSAGILIDQFCMPDIYKRHIGSENGVLAENTYFMTKAESHSIAVAAGSIIARTSFVKEMDKLSKEVGFTLPKGASAKVDAAIARVIRTYGKEKLESIAKVHFANTQKAEKYL